MEDIQDKIDNYLFGRMSNVEAKTFEQAMDSDDTIREQFLFTRVVRHELSDRNEKLRSMQQWRKQTDRNRHPNPIRRIKWYSIGGFSAAAMIVLGVFLFRPEPPTTDVHRNVIAYDTQRSATRTQPTYVEYTTKKVSKEDEIYKQISAVTESCMSSAASSQNVAASMSVPDSYSQSQYEKYMREVEYYQKQAANYRREAEYYKKQAENYESEQQYHLKQAEKYQREAADYSRRGDYDRAKAQTRYAQSEIDKAKTQAGYARSAWDKYRTQMRYAKDADEKAATNLRYAREAIR